MFKPKPWGSKVSDTLIRKAHLGLYSESEKDVTYRIKNLTFLNSRASQNMVECKNRLRGTSPFSSLVAASLLLTS